jgi:hypothetical protein
MGLCSTYRQHCPPHKHRGDSLDIRETYKLIDRAAYTLYILFFHAQTFSGQHPIYIGICYKVHHPLRVYVLDLALAIRPRMLA